MATRSTFRANLTSERRDPTNQSGGLPREDYASEGRLLKPERALLFSVSTEFPGTLGVRDPADTRVGSHAQPWSRPFPAYLSLGFARYAISRAQPL